MRGILLIAGLVVYPLAVHVCVVLGLDQAAVIGLIAVSAANFAFALRAGRAAARWLLLYVVLALAGVASFYAGTAYALFLPPVAINLGLMLFFGAGLRAGARPLIERLMRVEYGADLPAPLQRYARQLTVLWTAFFAAMAATLVMLAAYAPLTVWSLFANVINYVLVILLFIAQYAYRYWRFRRFGIFMPWHLARRLAHTSIADPAHPFAMAARGGK